MTTETETETAAEPKAMLPSDLLMRGWCQGMAEDGDSVCLLRAFANYNRITPLYYGVLRTLWQYIDNVAKWNDAPGRTKEEVVALAMKVEYDLGLR